MAPARIFLVILFIASVSCKPKETTHELLSRLGFDPVQKPGVNFHKKRVAEDSDKARNNPLTYNSDTDSNLFVVRLPPHHPFYSNSVPEKLENEVIAERPMNFPSNGKPNQVYHWNIPLMKKLAKHKKTHHDSKIVHLKILPQDREEYKFYQKLKKDGKPNIYKLKRRDHVMSVKDLGDHQNDRPMDDEEHTLVVQSRTTHKDSKLTHIATHPKHSVMRKYANKSDSKLSVIKYDTKNENQVLNHEKNKLTDKIPQIYSPAIPKHNSFFKYFPGNGKPKSFYVIEKGQTPSRFHRLM